MAAAKLTLDLLETTSLEVSCRTRMPFFSGTVSSRLPEHGTWNLFSFQIHQKILYFSTGVEGEILCELVSLKKRRFLFVLFDDQCFITTERIRIRQN